MPTAPTRPRRYSALVAALLGTLVVSGIALAVALVVCCATPGAP